MGRSDQQGDRQTPMLIPRRGNKNYIELWADQDGTIVPSLGTERLPDNTGRGSIEDINDETAQTDKVSVPPLLSRLYSLLRFEHRTVDDKDKEKEGAPDEPATPTPAGAPETATDGESNNPDAASSAKPLPPAAAFPDVSPSGFRVPAAKLDHEQLDERLKVELRYVGLLAPSEAAPAGSGGSAAANQASGAGAAGPDFDAHLDDDVAERLRLLQSELRRQSLTNGARKTRLLELARDRLAFQEYATIRDDLDTQVQQAYLKRTRTLGKSKKHHLHQPKHRPGGAGGGSHPVVPQAATNGANGSAADAAGGAPPPGIGISRPGIGDLARTLMDRRRRWASCIGPVFADSQTTVPPRGRENTVFEPGLMAELERAEAEAWWAEEEGVEVGG